MAPKTAQIKKRILHSVEGRDISQGEGVHDNALTFPNFLTLLRIVLTPFIVVMLIADERAIAFGIFAFAACSDFLDGWVAKKFNAQTRFGAFLDPVADKILITSMYLWFGAEGLVPYWFVILVISRDVFILAGVLLTWIAFERLWVAPLAVGKLTIFTQLVLVGLVFLFHTFGDLQSTATEMVIEWVTYFVAGLTFVSVLAYAAQWFVRVTEEEPDA